MTLILPGADIRGYYAALNIPLPEWARGNAPARCFADPDHHTNSDRHPSTSVHLETGAWQCHGCGARGGAYDAATIKGHSPRSAIELMITHRLIDANARVRTARDLARDPRPPVRPRPATRSRTLAADEADVLRWHTALRHRPNLLNRLRADRGWAFHALSDLQVGWDGRRLTIPICDEQRRLQGVLRYQPFQSAGPKMIAVPGTRLGLIPHPACELRKEVVLVEGPPDMIAARSRGIAAIAVPGDQAWREEWATALAGHVVTIVMDADPAGRAAAKRIARALTGTSTPTVVDLAPERADGYDLTDYFNDHPHVGAAHLAGVCARIPVTAVTA